MKLLMISTIVVAVAGGTWTWVAPTTKRPIPQNHAMQDAQERIGLRRMLNDREDLNFVNLVVGTATDGMRTFRARMVEDSHPRPVFGQARRICQSAPDVAECWEIATLQVDGQIRETRPQVINEAPATAFRAPNPVPTEDIETSDIPRQTAATSPERSEAPRATHLVARPIINARSGPGLANPVLFKLSQGARLGLISEDGEWGKFLVLDGDGQGAEAWASLKILEDLR
ncbi:MAG: SH3 domain-containing protein [Pseudomonadota bacterium]